jgi:hypothetical protein
MATVPWNGEQRRALGSLIGPGVTSLVEASSYSFVTGLLLHPIGLVARGERQARHGTAESDIELVLLHVPYKDHAFRNADIFHSTTRAPSHKWDATGPLRLLSSLSARVKRLTVSESLPLSPESGCIADVAALRICATAEVAVTRQLARLSAWPRRY